MLTTADDNRATINVEKIKNPIAAPGLIRVDEPDDEPTDRRVSLTQPKLQKAILGLFKEKDTWKVDEIVTRLNHPKDPIQRMMKTMGEFDPIRRVYKLKSMYYQ